MRNGLTGVVQKMVTTGVAFFYGLWVTITAAHGYAFNQIVPDVRQPASISGGSACPIASHRLSGPGGIVVQWSTTLSASPQIIFTANETPAGSLNEIESVIQQSLNVWTNVAGTSLTPSSLAPLTRVTPANSCGADGLNTICFDQPDMGFAPGVLAFTRVVTADAIGIQLGSAVSTEVGQILDADVYFNPSDPVVTFATPAALVAHPTAYDLESLLTHELGHSLGFSHSAVWNAMMFPFAPAPGTFTGARPAAQSLDAPLSDDDRTGLRVLYPDSNDTTYVGSIQGRIVPANPLSLPTTPAGVTGIFGSHVVAVDAQTGAVIAGTLGGWSCQAPGPTQFDGTYQLEHLPLVHGYNIYTEALDGVVAPTSVGNALTTLCRNSTTDPGWPVAQACTVPAVNLEFTARMRPSP